MVCLTIYTIQSFGERYTKCCFLVLLSRSGSECLAKPSQLRHGGSYRIRDYGDNVHGYPDLKPHQRIKLLDANHLLRYMILICKACARLHMPFYIENPLNSMLWHHPWIRALPNFVLNRFNYCQFGKVYRKATRVLESGSRVLRDVTHHCKLVNGRCSASGERHFVLVGKDSQGFNWTTRACPYPVDMCTDIARVLVGDVMDRFIDMRSQAAGISKAPHVARPPH